VVDDEFKVDPLSEDLYYTQRFFIDLFLVESKGMGLDVLIPSTRRNINHTWNFDPRLGQREWKVNKVDLSFTTGQRMCCIGDLNGFVEVWLGFKPNRLLGIANGGRASPGLLQTTSRLSTQNYRKLMCFMAYAMSLDHAHGVAMADSKYPDINSSDVLSNAVNLM
jgi:hypothetical protein